MTQKPKSIQGIEQKMEGLEPNSLRYQILDAAKSFKSSWIELGQYLFTVYRDKHYKEWGYLTFEAYTSKEIGIRQPTAMKLLKSYSFLENEEPKYLKRHEEAETKPTQVPSYESVNTLRLAKQNKNLSVSDYKELREDVLEEAKEEEDVKKKIKYILKSNVDRSPEAKEDRKFSVSKRVLTGLKGSREELINLDAPTKIVKKIEELIEILEDYTKP